MEHIEKEQQKKNIITEFPEVKEAIHESHEKKRAVPHGVKAMEIFALPKEWDDFIEYGADDLRLSERDSERFFALIQNFIDEDLTEKDEAELKAFMARYEAIEHPQRGEARGS